MSNTIKTFYVHHDSRNSDLGFSSGDLITGKVVLDLTKDCKVDSLYVKLKGKAQVFWTEVSGTSVKSYGAKEKYFTIRQFIIEERKGNTIEQGNHVYPFTFQIPAGDLPPSYSDKFGCISYTLEAVLSRSMRKDNKTFSVFNLTNNVKLNSDPTLMLPQKDHTEKNLKVFSKGSVSMDVTLERTGFHQGEGIKVVANIINKSTRDVKPKYKFYEKRSYFVKNKRKVETKEIEGAVGDPIPPSESQTVTKIFTVPPDANQSIYNCNVLKIEYRLQVYLDVKYAFDPEVKFPVVILPALRGYDGEILPAHPPYGSEAFTGAYMPGGTSFPQNPAAAYPLPPPYGTNGIYPPVDYPKY